MCDRHIPQYQVSSMTKRCSKLTTLHTHRCCCLKTALVFHSTFPSRKVLDAYTIHLLVPTPTFYAKLSSVISMKLLHYQSVFFILNSNTFIFFLKLFFANSYNMSSWIQWHNNSVPILHSRSSVGTLSMSGALLFVCSKNVFFSL